MKLTLLPLLLLLAWSVPGQQVRLQQGHLVLMAGLDANGKFSYAVNLKDRPVILPAHLGLQFASPSVLLEQFTLEGIDTARHQSTWKPVWGEEDEIINNYQSVTFRLRDKGPDHLQLHLTFRIFREGIGFRYTLPRQDNLKHFTLAEEHSAFRMAGDHKAFWIPGDCDTNEYLWETTPLTAIDAAAAVQREKDIAVQSPIGAFTQNAIGKQLPETVQTPLMMKSADGIFINIHEAALVNYPAMNLALDKSSLTFSSVLVPGPTGIKAWAETPFHTPWRTILIADDARELLASRMILNLNEPGPASGTAWIRPQKYIGVWWEMHTGKATWQLDGGKHGATTANVKRYIDFAATHGFDGVLVEGWNTGWEDWFGNWKEDVFDFTTPYPDYDINLLTRYAQNRKVRLIMHHETAGAVTSYERRIDTAFVFMKAHGMNTVKTGYVGRIIPRGEHHDGQWMVNHYNRVAQKALQQNIMVVSHEPVRPTGLHRTWPNWMASEAARGTEFNNAPTLGIPPEHQVILPFTRLIGGPMDYTPGLFHFRLNEFEPQRTQRVLTTLAKQLALYVTMYSPVQMAADLPEHYERYPDAFQFIKEVPVDWSETRILEAEPGDYLTIARRRKNGSDWFLGSVTDEHARVMTIPLTFLEKGTTYEAVLYQDAADADYDRKPEAYQIRRLTVNAKTILKIPIARGGGCAVSIRPVKH